MESRVCGPLVDGCGGLQVYLFPLTFDDAMPNLCCGLTFLVLLVGVVNLLETGGALGSVRAFETAVQAIVSHAVAIAIAGLLMQYGWDLRRQIVGMGLIRRLRVGAP